MRVSLFGGTGFILSRYAQLYPENAYIEDRSETQPHCNDVLYGISTTHNYNVLQPETRKLDIETNLCHLMDVLPNVRGAFAFLSSWFVYGREPGRICHWPSCPMREVDTCAPTGMYSITKLAAEQILQSYCQTAAIGKVSGPSSYRILRLCNVIGNDPRAGKQKNALEMMLGKVVRGETVEVYEGDNYRDILHVEDVCRAIHLCINTPATLNDITNIGRGESHRMIDIVEYAIAKTGSRSEVKRVPVPAFHRAVQVPDFWMSVDRLAALGYRPELSLWESVDRVLAGLEARQS